jgi:excisionase family DNA binding protein
MPVKNPKQREWLSVSELAEELGVPRASVYGWNSDGTGPPRVKVGRHVRYRRRDVELWLADHAVTER